MEYADTLCEAHGKPGYRENMESDPMVSGRILGEIIVRKLVDYTLNTDDLVGVGTDNCPKMTGVLNGAVTAIQEVCKNAVRNACRSHLLDLALGSTSKVNEIRNAIATMKQVAEYFHHSSKRSYVLKENNRASILNLCETRWIQKIDAVCQFVDMYQDVCHALHNISTTWRDAESCSKAFSLLKNIQSPEFIIGINCLAAISSLFGPCARLFQKVDISVPEATQYSNDLIASIQKIRDNIEEKFSEIFELSNSMLESVDAEEIRLPRRCAKQTHRSNLPAATPEEYFRRTIYIPLVDQVLDDLRRRMSVDNFKGILLFALIPVNFSQDENALVDYISSFFPSCPKILISGELTQWKQATKSIPRDQTKSVQLLLKNCDKTVFPMISSCLQILLTFVVSAATAERSFSALRRLKTWLRNRMSENRLTGLALLHVHRSIKISVDRVITRFANMCNRKLNFVI